MSANESLSTTTTVRVVASGGGAGQVAGGSSLAASLSEGNIWDRAIRGIIHTLVFLLPVLFTPWTYEPLEFSKQMVLFVLTSAALVAWLVKLLVTRSWRFVKTPLDMPIMAFVLVYLLASIFSVDKVASFLGFYGSFSGNFFQVVFLALFYYIVINSFQTTEQIKRLLGTFLFSSFLVLFYTVLQFFGVFAVRFSFAKQTSFNTVGGLLMVSLFSALVVVMGLTGSTVKKNWFGFFHGRLWRILAMVFGFVVLLAINFLYAWAALLVGILVFMIFQLGMAKTFVMKNFIMPLIMLVLVVSFVIIQVVFPSLSLSKIVNFQLPLEVRLDYTTAMPVLKGVVVERPVLGSGPGTFAYAFSRHRDQNFNQSPFWNVRFDKAPSEAAEQLVGTGILGFLAFEVLSATFMLYALFYLFRRRDDEENWNLCLTMFAAFAVLWVAHWFFFFNSVMVFAYWFSIAGFLALAGVAGAERMRSYSFSMGDNPRKTVSVVSVVSFALVLVVVFLFFAASIYAADVFYQKGLTETAKAETFPEAQDNFRRALDLNRFRQDYMFTYSEFLLVQINQELSKKEPNATQIQNWLAESIQRSRLAVELSPNNWAAWERLANLYASARPLVAGVDNFIIDSLQQATGKDAKNPVLFTELGQMYQLASRKIDPAILGKGVDSDGDGLSDEQEKVLGSDADIPDTNGNGMTDGNEVLAGLNPGSQKSEALTTEFLGQYVKTDSEMLLKATDAFRKAISLKADYAPAYYQLSLTLAQQNKLDEAAAELEKALKYFPSNITLKFQLGVYYLNNNKPDLGARQFSEIVAAVPNDSNARFSLALAYERMGNLKRALVEYKKVFELNSDNEFLKQKIAEIEAALQSQSVK